ncbi:hypothetical protein QAD02_022841 [Eretmocerus hayati]|uniref:Uncharacterized protein n=1 Tax=Eretmocerus hayati TaxID=131215 RepID=A0ACC2PUI1_9HYME|nr:hypothetical protein QAD02_022841 [Eretmocerus hayati]
MNFLLLICAVAILPESIKAAANLETAYQWRYIDYVWPSEDVKQDAIATGAYNYTNIMPMDVDVAKDGRVFITALNFPGVPARLGVVTNQQGESGPLIQPYPNWASTDLNNCDSIIDVYRVAIDSCNRLWVLDSGKDYAARNPNKCPPKLLTFDLGTDTLIHAVVVPEHIAFNPQTRLSLLANVKVETYGQRCEDTTEILVQDTERLQYADGIKVIPQPIRPEEEVWILTNRYPALVHRKLNFSEPNFFILRSPVAKLIAGTKCQNPEQTIAA